MAGTDGESLEFFVEYVSKVRLGEGGFPATGKVMYNKAKV